MVRDSQKSKVYKAERSVQTLLSDTEYKFTSLQQCIDFVCKIECSKWYKSVGLCGHNISISDGRGSSRARAYCSSNRICLPRWARNKMTILHEICHMHYTSNFVASHGREFCKLFINAVKRWIGKEEADLLRYAYKTYGVKYVVRSN